MTIRWERRDAAVITVILETPDGYVLTLVDRQTGETRLGPRQISINPDRLKAYGFKARWRAA